MAQGSRTTHQVWVWCPVDNDRDVPFQHPSDVPADDQIAAKTLFVDRKRGPRIARISPATLLQMKGNLALIAESGATREVPKPRVLPWYEGLLLLEELETIQGQGGHLEANWCDKELKTVLDQERNNRRLSSSLYTEQRLVNTAVTGNRFIDGDDHEWSYRRENLRSDDKNSLLEGETRNNFFKIREIAGYLPPWEAFCNEKCGFYQDFYLVRWDYPYSEVDYSRVENGSASTVGATWEPDECLPAHLDPLRLSAKRAWIKKRREHEQRIADEKLREKQPAIKRQAPSPEQLKIKEEEEEKKPPVKRARHRRDGTPLEKDLVLSTRGHDFTPEDVEKTSVGVRQGWPKNPEDYPKGYMVANPPGFCWEGCDCMDDQRPQRPWETNKAWLEDVVRSTAAQSAIETFSAQTHFVTQRGRVSKMWYFETNNTSLGDQAHSQAALDFASIVENTLKEVLNSIPVNTLKPGTAPLRFPTAPFLLKDVDYEPLSFEAVMHNGGPMPPWLKLDPDTGRLFTKDTTIVIRQPLKLDIVFSHAEGTIGTGHCAITSEQPGVTSWAAATAPVVKHFTDMNLCQLEAGTRNVLGEHLSEIYDFKQHIARDRLLGEWLDTMSRILRMLRSAAVANVTLSPAHNRISLGLARPAPAPRTPPKR